MIFKTIKEIEIDDYTLLKKGLYVDMELSQIRQILSFININLPDKNQKRNILLSVINNKCSTVCSFTIKLPLDFYSFFEESGKPVDDSVERKMALTGYIDGGYFYYDFKLDGYTCFGFVNNISIKEPDIFFFLVYRKNGYYLYSKENIDYSGINGILVCCIKNGVVIEKDNYFFYGNKFDYAKIWVKLSELKDKTKYKDFI